MNTDDKREKVHEIRERLLDRVSQLCEEAEEELKGIYGAG